MARPSKVAVLQKRGDRMVTLNLRVPASFKRHLRRESARLELSCADLVVERFSVETDLVGSKPYFPDTDTETAWRSSPRTKK